jgi:3-hydroxyacyl-[acyl-carrier-protein] dehydratase
VNSPGLWLRFPPDHPALAGHFPQRPIVPGVMLLDAALHAIDPAGTHWHVSSVKFHRPVGPDESMRLDCIPQLGGAVRVELHAAQGLVLTAAIERRRP